MSISRAIRLPRAVRRLRDRFAPGGLILLYHRVTDVGSDPWSLCVTPRHFAEHLEVLRKYTHPMRLQQLAQGLYRRERARRPVAITFDDGYADNLHNAKPLLENYDIPATAFVTTGYIGSEREFWWDELERMLLQPGHLPEQLRFHINGSTYEWELGEAAYYTDDTYRCLQRWHVEQQDDPSPRHYLYRTLWQLLCPMHDSERRKVLDDLLAWGNAKPTGRLTHRALSASEIVQLAQGGLVEVGAHTVTHPSLPVLPLVLQRNEIQGSKNCLEEIVGRPVTSFSYPFGDYTAKTVAIVQEAEFARACSCAGDTVQGARDPFELPRIEVQDCDGEEFARQLSKDFHCDLPHRIHETRTDDVGGRPEA